MMVTVNNPNTSPARPQKDRADSASGSSVDTGANHNNNKQKNKMKLGRFFKKESNRNLAANARKHELKADVSISGSIASMASSMSMASMASSMSSVKQGGSRRNSKKRNQVISQFVRDDNSKSQKVLLWGDHSDTTSEESNSSNNPAAESGGDSPINSHHHHHQHHDDDGGFSSKLHEHSYNTSEEFQEEDEEDEYASDYADASPEPTATVAKSVTFSTPLVAMCVEIESSWDIWGYGRVPSFVQDSKDREMRNAGKARATLIDGGGRLWISKEDMAKYDPTELMANQPRCPKFLRNDELKALRHQKERLAKYRRKLKKKLQKVRKTRCARITALANEAVVESQNRHNRIIARYKMAAPNALEHRRRRQIKFALARAALTVFLVQQRQRHLQAIRQGAQDRDDRKHSQESHINVGLPHYHIRHQMKRIMVHQASMKALIRLQRNNVKMVETIAEPLIFPLERPKPPKKTMEEELHQEDDDDDEDSDDDEWFEDEEDADLDTDDIYFRRLEWATVSFLAAARSKEFDARRRQQSQLQLQQQLEQQQTEDEREVGLVAARVEIEI